MKSLSRLAWTIRYLAPAQVWYRARRRWREVWWKLVGTRSKETVANVWLLRLRPDIGVEDFGLGAWVTPHEHEKALAELDQLERNTFHFLNQSLKFDGAIIWDTTNASHLWRYHLHYFNYLEGLVVLQAVGGGDAERAWNQFRRLILCWIDSNRLIQGDGWHPYTVSLRLVNWLNAAEVFFERIKSDPVFEQRFIGSLAAQANILSENLELDVRGNHLLENIRALIWVGTGLDSPKAQGWLSAALALLREELAEQVLSDGGHFERCPGYHAVVLRRLIEIGQRLRTSTGSTPAYIEDAVKRMLEFLKILQTPNGGLPLLKDTAVDAHPPVDVVLTEGALLLKDRRFLAVAPAGLRTFLQFGEEGLSWFKSGGKVDLLERENTHFLPESGYVCSRTRAGDFFILDVGRPCPDYLPAHAHADLFTFDLWIGGRPWVVDSGVYEYTAGYWRDFFRATRAHSTVEVDGLSQSDVYSSFRVGRRARVHGVACQRVRQGVWLAQGYHDGYDRLGAVHRRVVLFRPGSYWVVMDSVTGRGEHEIRTRLQLQPNVEALEVSDGSWTLAQDGNSIFATTSGYLSVTAKDGHHVGWYSDRFGERTSRVVLECSAKSELPFIGLHALAVNGPASFGEVRTGVGGIVSVTVAVDSERFELHLPNEISTAAFIS
jgi:uncharacterized heparinase superfamily protein